ncbi:hypothetical protein [Lactococcus kimchii]|uniref:hypothetical protein n=1 Tax=Lactococcus sp. S-13 TaxID=2507158 RepID=UPI0010233957|nr:hypothetical protein [Lactococcus sp. S-13]RZI49559.1 hypothetical protein EQJ87_09070 [Lactococcus sp. S-13]
MFKKITTIAITATLAGAAIIPVGNIAFAGEKAPVTVATHDHDHDDADHKDPRVGYQWKCHTCGYVSEWHLLASTAVERANAHMVKYPGHVTSVYGVREAE